MPGRLCTACGRLAPDEAVSCPECGEMLHPVEGADAVVELAKRVAKALGPGYRVKDTIGRGGYAVVFRVHDEKLDRDLAAKALVAEFAATPEIAERFRQEARLAARLSHPNIVPIFFVGDERETPCLVMPLIDGETLAARLRREGRLAPRVALSLVQDIANALDFAHGHAVVHRDVKPDNIMLELGSGRALLTDFGIAKALSRDSWLTASGVLVGTPYYMSPEQATGERDLDVRSDVYSLAVVVFEMLAGTPPFDGLNAQVVLSQHVTAPVPDLADYAAEVSPAVAQVIARAMAKAPSDRPRTAGEFARELERAFGASAMRRSGAAVIERQSADDIRLFRTLSVAPGDPVAALRDADDVAGVTEAARAMLDAAKAAAQGGEAERLITLLGMLAERTDREQPALRQPLREVLDRAAADGDMVTVLAGAWRAGDGTTQSAVERVFQALMPAAGEPLVALLRRERRAELVLLADRVGALGQERAEALARDDSVGVVQAFVEALRESGRPSETIERWLALVARHPNAKVRALAADVAASRGGALAERIGRRLVGDETPGARAAALRALGSSRRREALPELVRVLREGAVEDQTAAAEALGVLGLPEVVAPLAAVLDRKRMLRLERGPVQQAAARALAALPGGAGADTLRSLVGDRDPVIARIAAQFASP